MAGNDGAGGAEGAARRVGGRWELTPPRAEALLQALRETVVVLDAQGEILYTNRALEGFLGHEVGTFDHLPIELIHPDETEEFVALYRRCISTPGVTVSGEFRMQAANGHWKLVEGSAVNLLHEPTIGAIVVITRNLSDHARPTEEAADRNRRVRDFAERDALTGLATRTRVLAATRRSLERRRSTGWRVAVAVVTVNRYEVVGAQLGQAAADALALAAAERISELVAPDDLVARIGADTFAVLLESADAGADARSIARHLAEELATTALPHSPDGVGPSAGWVEAADAEVDADGLLQRAEAAQRRWAAVQAESST